MTSPAALPRTSLRRRARLLLPAAVLPVLLLAACGGAGYVEAGGGIYVPADPYPPYAPVPPPGEVDVDNLSFEYVLTFYLSPAASGWWSEELLGGPLAPGYAVWVGDFDEDLYDAEADLEFGDLVTWYDVFVPGGEVTVFEVW